MNLFRRKSDREIVESLRQGERLRRPVGLAFIAFGLALLALAIWGEFWMRRQALEIADSLSDIHRADSSAVLAYVVGLRSGVLLSQGITIGTLVIFLGLRFRFGGRKDRMLIQNFDIATNGQAAPK